MENTLNRVLTIEEACKYLGYKRSYVHKLTSNGTLPHSKPNGKRIFFDRDKLEAWMLSGEMNVATENRNAITITNSSNGK